MSISARLKSFLEENQIRYSVMTHTTAYTAQGDLWERACQDRSSVDGRRNDSGRPAGAESRETR
jgi:hypothetical protein